MRHTMADFLYKEKTDGTPSAFLFLSKLLACFESLLELINTSASVNKLLLTCEEGVTLGTNFNSDLAALGGSGCNRLAACASDYAFLIVRMDSCFHFISPRLFYFDVL